MPADEFETVQAESDPLEQARRATDLLSLYQQRSVELARLRRDAINRAVAERGLSYAAVAEAVGLSKARITQIRQTAPPTERGFFGVGPVTVAVPERAPAGGGTFGVLTTEEAEAAQRLTDLLTALNFQVRPVRVPPAGAWELPAGDLVVLGSPASSPALVRPYDADHLIGWEQDRRGRWVLVDDPSGREFTSPLDDGEPVPADLGYLGRLPRFEGDGTVLLLGGIHPIGTLGVVTWLAEHLADVHAAVGARPFSAVVRCTHDGLTITGTDVVVPPRPFW